MLILGGVLDVTSACFGQSVELVSNERNLVVVVGPQHGSYRSRFEQILDGATKGVASLTLKRPRLLSFDDKCDARAAETVAREIVLLRPALVIGHPCSSAAIAAAIIYADAGVLFLAPGVDHRGFSDNRAGPTVFRLTARSDSIGSWTARVVGEAYPHARVAVIHDRTGYARTLARDVVAGLMGLGLAPVFETGITAALGDYGSVVAQLRQHKASVVYFAGFASEAEVILRQIRSAGLGLDFLGSETLLTREFVAFVKKFHQRKQGEHKRDESSRRRVRIGLTVPRGFSIDGVGFPGEFFAQTQIGLSARSVAAVQIWHQARQQTGTLQGRAVAHAIADGRFATQIGDVEFDNKGDAGLAYANLLRFDGRRWVRLTE